MIMQGAEPFFLPGGNKGVLLVHGFTGMPSEMLLLGRSLQEQGYTVLGLIPCVMDMQYWPAVRIAYRLPDYLWERFLRSFFRRRQRYDA